MVNIARKGASMILNKSKKYKRGKKEETKKEETCLEIGMANEIIL